tara:strand:- start:368 stop:721 length:354 start_codon:yes stop_codon:yes gene_type:complete
MDIAREDNAHRLIECNIYSIRNKLLDNYSTVSKGIVKNIFLRDVAREYRVHRDSMLKDKEHEYEALWKLTNYIQDAAKATKDQSSIDYLTEELKQDQKSIIKELKNVKKQITHMKKQ